MVFSLMNLGSTMRPIGFLNFTNKLVISSDALVWALLLSSAMSKSVADWLSCPAWMCPSWIPQTLDTLVTIVWSSTELLYSKIPTTLYFLLSCTSPELS